MLQTLRPFDGNVNNVLERLVEALGNRVTLFHNERFQIALSQYARPIVGTDDFRYEEMPFDIIENLMMFTGAEPVHPQTGPQNQGSRYTVLQGDGQFFQEQFGDTTAENIDRLRAKPSRKFKKQVKRTIASARNTSFPNNKTFRHPESDSTKAYSYKSRSMVTCHAGLYSSILAKDGRSELQATIITSALRTLVNKMSFARFACLHIASIAMRQAYIILNNQQRYQFYAYFFADKDTREKAWRYILQCAMNYQPGGRTSVTSEMRNEAITSPLSGRIDDIMDANGDLQDGNIHLFKSYIEDISYIYLYNEMEDVPLLRNILLLSRKVWYNGFGQLFDFVPTSLHMGIMMTEIVHDVDLAFHQNIVTNFRSRYCDYLRRRLKEQARCPRDWNNTQDFRDTVIQAVTSQNRQQATNIIQQSQHIGQAIQGDVVDFVHRMRSKYHSNIQGFNNDICLQELINEATIPEQWPANQDRLVRHIFQRIWGLALYEGEENR